MLEEITRIPVVAHNSPRVLEKGGMLTVESSQLFELWRVISNQRSKLNHSQKPGCSQKNNLVRSVRGTVREDCSSVGQTIWGWERAGVGIRGRQESLAEIAGKPLSRHPAAGKSMWDCITELTDQPGSLASPYLLPTLAMPTESLLSKETGSQQVGE